MEHTKIIEFYKEYKDKEFPYFETLSVDQCLNCREKIATNFRINFSKDSLIFLKNLNVKLQYFNTFPYDFDNYKLSNLLNEIGIVKMPINVYVNWYKFDLIDQMKFRDLDLYLLDLWYPQEDIEIFSTECNWIISLSHDSIVKYNISPSSP